MANTNNPPDVSLDLTMDEAKFLLENCETNMSFALAALNVPMSREATVKLVMLNERFKSLREKLMRQGVKLDV